MKSTWIVTIAAGLVLVLALSQPIVAAPQEDAAAPADAEATEGGEETEQRKMPIGLYVEVGTGSVDIDALDLSVRTSTTQSSLNTMLFEDADARRAAIGWRLPNNKGSFRAVWNSVNENGYEFDAVGRIAELDQNINLPNAITENLDWWTVNVSNGTLTGQRTPPQWSLAADANGDQAVQRDEVTYIGADITTSAAYASDLENRVHTLDLLYGRDFGPRRIQGRWWVGLRYLAYEGTLLQGAWLQGPTLGRGYTDGSFVRLLAPRQETTGFGPTGSLGFNYNLFNSKVQLFTNFQIAMLLADVESDTGPFFAVVNDNSDPTNTLLVQGRLRQDRSRTNWNTHADLGVRFNIKGGLSLEMSYFIDGYLDSVLTAAEIQVPLTVGQSGQGTSGIYSTQDLVVDGWRASVAFQF